MEKIFPNIQVHPILIPPYLFRDRFNEINSYFEMNPSMFMDEEGNVTLLIRNVNYRKFTDKRFIIYQNHSNTIYTLMKGVITEGKPLTLDTFICETITNDYGLPSYPSYWYGVEDIRFITSSTILGIVPELHTGGKPSLFRASLSDDNRFHSFSQCKPYDHAEKNWLPFIDEEGKEKVIYSVSPFIIKSIEEKESKRIELPEETSQLLEGYHGSTNGIPYQKNSRLFLIHVNQHRVYHRWLLYDLLEQKIHVSEPFVFFQYSYIEFPLSLCNFQNRIFVSMGVNDNKAMVLELSLPEIESYLSIQNKES